LCSAQLSTSSKQNLLLFRFIGTRETISLGELEQNVFIPLKNGFNRHHGAQGKEVRDMHLRYFNKEGKVEWQNKTINQCCFCEISVM
jgi:hypothetical protein